MVNLVPGDRAIYLPSERPGTEKWAQRVGKTCVVVKKDRGGHLTVLFDGEETTCVPSPRNIFSVTKTEWEV